MHVQTTPQSPHATLTIGGQTFPALIGRTGPIAESDKQEGDGHTPLGTYPLLYGYYRADRVPAPPATGFVWHPTNKTMGWCDDAAHEKYNHPVTLPFAASHEEMWREDTAYDYVVVLGHNHPHAVPGKGSAIFLHLWHPGKIHTAGCVALKLEDFQQILPYIKPGSSIAIS